MLATASTYGKWAGGLSMAAGLGFGPLAVYGAIYFAKHGKVWFFAGFPTYGEGPFESLGVPTSAPLITGFAAVCAAECALGYWLWRGRRSSMRLSMALLPLEVAYWLGFALPGGIVFGAARTLAVIATRRREGVA